MIYTTSQISTVITLVVCLAKINDKEEVALSADRFFLRAHIAGEKMHGMRQQYSVWIIFCMHVLIEATKKRVGVREQLCSRQKLLLKPARVGYIPRQESTLSRDGGGTTAT